VSTNITERNLTLDILRIFAVIAVIAIHVSSNVFSYATVGGGEFAVAYIYDSLVRFGVPFFLMISGVLFLSSEKEITVKNMLVHNILRLLIIYFLWSAIYTLPSYIAANGIKNWGEPVNVFTASAFHLWYLPAIMAIYLIVPFLRTWIKAASKKELETLLILFMVFNLVKATIINLNISYSANSILGMFPVTHLPIHLCYFILGYYLYTYGLPVKKKSILVLAIIVPVTLNIVWGIIKSRQSGVLVTGIYDSDSVTTFIAICAFFVLLTDLLKDKKLTGLTGKMVTELSKDSFGVYLVHILVITLLGRAGLSVRSFPAVFSIPVVIAVTFIVSTLISAILRRIPFIGRYIC